MRRAAPLAAALLLAACAVGPDYKRPDDPRGATGRFVDPGLTKVAAGDAYGQWWRLFQDPALDRLVADALAHNTDVRQAAANLRRARALLSEARAGRLPTTDLSASYMRRRIGVGSLAGNGFPVATDPADPGTPAPATPDAFTFDFFQAGFDASYEVDLFGRVFRQIEAARADYEAQQAALDAARVAVAAETARNYALACGYAGQAQVARETVQLQGQTLDLTRRLLDAGRGTQREVDQASVQVENARAQVPALEAERRASLYALAVLTGRPPAEIDGAAARCTVAPAVRTLLPVGDGQALIARRRDVRQAERTLAADTARIGIETAALYPRISLMGSATLGATQFDQLGKSSSFSYSIGPLISWSFPNIAVARARIRQAEAGADASLAAFDGTVLTALQEVEQALARYAGALDRNAALRRSEASASNAARIAALRFNAGRDSFLQRLDAERDRAAARSARSDSDRAVAEAQVALFKALGGGWEGAVEPTRREPAKP